MVAETGLTATDFWLFRLVQALFSPSNLALAPCLRAQAAIELIVNLLPLRARLHDALTSRDTFCTALGYRIGVLPNKYGRKQLLN